MKFNRILVPLDGSPAAETALEAAAQLAQLSHGEIHLVRCQPSSLDSDLPVLVPEVGEEAATRHCETYLSGRAFDLSQRGLRSSFRVLPAGDVVGHILAAAAATEADVIVLSSHGRTGLSHLLQGSVAECIAREAECMVLVVGQRAASRD